jgi:hypothetical protein
MNFRTKLICLLMPYSLAALQENFAGDQAKKGALGREAGARKGAICSTYMSRPAGTAT